MKNHHDTTGVPGTTQKLGDSHDPIFKKRVAVLLIIFTLIGAALSATLWILPRNSVRVYSFMIRSINAVPGKEPMEWAISEDIKLDTRIYLPQSAESEGLTEKTIGSLCAAFNNRSTLMPDYSASEFTDVPETPTKVFKAALMFHGYTRSLEDNDYMARQLAARGIVVVCISSRGHGMSTGQIISSLNETFGDALAAYLFLTTFPAINSSNILAHGTSMGGAQSLFLALYGYASHFVVWFPAVGYYVNSRALYDMSNPAMQGLICAGTNDTCGSCIPEYNLEFIQNNPQVDLIWREGATHTDPRFYMDNVHDSIAWLEENWDLEKVNPVVQWYYAGYLAAFPLGIMVLIDVWFIVQYLYRRYGRLKH